MERDPKILVIDDEASIRESLTAFLEDYNFEVTSAESAEEALELLQNYVPDVAIVDLRLPEMSGDAMIIKAHELHAGIKFIIHTGSVQFTPSAELKRIGMSQENIILKPLTDLSIIINKIQGLLAD